MINRYWNEVLLMVEKVLENSNEQEEPKIIEVNGKTAEVLLFINDFIDKRGFSPSTREICQGVQLKSTSSVSAHIKKLETLGFIEKIAERPRTIKLTGKLVN